MRTNLAFVKVIQLEFFSSLPQWRSSSGLFAKISKRRSSGGKKNESKWKFSCRKFSFRDVMTSFANKEKSFFFFAKREKFLRARAQREMREQALQTYIQLFVGCKVDGSARSAFVVARSEKKFRVGERESNFLFLHFACVSASRFSFVAFSLSHNSQHNWTLKAPYGYP